MKYLYSFLIVISLSFFANAQKFEVNFTSASATGSFSQQVNLGYLGGVTFLFPIRGFTAVLSGQYGFWDEANNPTAEKFNYTNFPVIFAGARSYLGDFYISTLAGAYPVKVVTTDKQGNESEFKETKAGLQGGVGYEFPLSFFHVDAFVNYLWVEDYPQFQFGLGVLFGK